MDDGCDENFDVEQGNYFCACVTVCQIRGRWEQLGVGRGGSFL